MVTSKGEKVIYTIVNMKYTKATQQDEVNVEIFRTGGKARVEWLVRLCFVCK